MHLVANSANTIMLDPDVTCLVVGHFVIVFTTDGVFIVYIYVCLPIEFEAAIGC